MEIMEESDYHIEADKALDDLLEFLEKSEESYDIEPELESGVLSVIMPDDSEYVINKHTPSRQIWVSSPFTGAGYFEFDGKNWLPKRSEAAQGQSLFNFITSEITKKLDE